MSEPYRLRLLVLVLLVGGVMALLIAVRPVARAVSAAPPATAATGGAPAPGGGAPPSPRHHPDGRGGFARRPDHHWHGPGMAYAAPLSYGLDGRLLLAGLAVSAGVAGLLWYAAGAAAPALGEPGSPAAPDLALLRAELGRLEREQRQLREALDWQARLLAEVDRPPLPPDEE